MAPVQDAIKKADVLIEAMGWIRQFRDRVTVIKLGGSVMQDADALRHILLDIVFMETVGMRPVVVHGGGAAISAAMESAGIEPNFVQGRRFTDQATLGIVEQVLAGKVNRHISETINELGGKANSLNFETTNVLFGERLQLNGAAGEAPVDLGFVGKVTRVDRESIERLSNADSVPVIPSMCIDESGQKYNVNADTAATAVAQTLGAEKLMFLSDVNGVRSDAEDPDSIVHSLSTTDARKMMDSGQIGTGMIPKVEACLETLERGVQKVHIIDGRLRHSLLLEIFTNQGVGTQIVKDD